MHRATRMEVNTANLKANFQAIRSHVGPGPEIFAVVKADAYGHGALKVCRAFAEAGCRRYAVAIPDEALELLLHLAELLLAVPFPARKALRQGGRLQGIPGVFRRGPERIFPRRFF